jgi:hypothetical protein
MAETTTFASKARSAGASNYRDILESKKENINPLQTAINNAENKKKYSNVDPAKKAVSDLIYLVKGVDDGRSAWYYVLVERVKLQLFLKALNDDIIHLENYGKILYSAYGDEPPKSITDSLKEEYGIEE